jgi:hypothetical protein
MAAESKLHETSVVSDTGVAVIRQNCTAIEAGIASAVQRAKLDKVMGSAVP